MSYLDRAPDSRQRRTAIAGVIAIHALLAYVLLTGLIQNVGPRARDVLTGYFDPAPPPPPPPPQPSEQHKARQKTEKVTAETKSDLTKDDNQVEVIKDDSDTVDVVPKPADTGTPYNPPLPPRFKPRAVSPKNSPGGWAVTDDYPARDLREGNEGVTVFRATIGANGRVSACEVLKSSGHPGLDAATCKAVTARARFEPATDENGAKVTGSYTNSVLWQIPR